MSKNKKQVLVEEGLYFSTLGKAKYLTLVAKRGEKCVELFMLLPI